MIFGKFVAADLTKFQIRSGDKLLIMELVGYVKKIVAAKGLHYFNSTPTKTENEVPPIQSLTNRFHELSLTNNTRSQYFLKKLLSNADLNANRHKEGYRYDDETKLFSSYLRILVGPLAYETLYKNLDAALPSLSTANRFIRASNSHITEGVIRGQQLRIYLEQRKQPSVVCLSEDATRIVGKVQYDSSSNQLIGFVLPISNSTGLPIPFSYPARDAAEIINHFRNGNSVASFLNVIMAQPLGGAPPFCLLLFGSDNRYTAKDVLNRWQSITLELKKLGITVLTFASDSDPKYNSAMRQLSTIGKHNKDYPWFSSDSSCGPPFCVQDLIHIATKLRNFLLRMLQKNWNKNQIPFGYYFIRMAHLYELVDRFPRQHGLTASSLNPKDRQNFQSVEKMYDPRVITLLKNHVKGSEATVQFLQIIRDVIGAYMEHDLTPLQRIRKLWYSLFFIRIWRGYIISHKSATLKDNFLSVNCYACIEIIAHSLILCILHLRKMNKPELFLPYLYESQPCESIFRQFRSMTTTFSTVVNCTVKEAVSRISKIQLQNEIMNKTSSSFVYPRLIKKSTEPNVIYTLPSPEEILNEIVFCLKSATATAKKLGLITAKRPQQTIFNCKINTIITQAIRKKKTLPPKNDMESFELPNLKNIQLKDFSTKFALNDIDMRSPYVELHSATGKRIVVKKSSLCWLLRDESQKLSSDRLQRVKYSAKHTTSTPNDRILRNHGARSAYTCKTVNKVKKPRKK